MVSHISRFLHEPNRHYTAARLQQGRILLDSDINEGVRLLESEHRQLVLDAVGPKGSPNQGFSIGQPFVDADAILAANQTALLDEGDPLPPVEVVFNAAATGTPIHPVTVRAGSLYVGGTRLALERAEHVAFQRDYLQLRAEDFPTVTAGAPFRQLYFVHAWDQCVTALEDDEISEPMLRAPHSSVRVRTMRRVELFFDGLVATDTSKEAVTKLTTALEGLNAEYDEKSCELKSSARLQLTFAHGASSDPCAPCFPNNRRFLGAENVTLRIMLTSPTTYVWALDNAAPLFRVRVEGLDTFPTNPVKVFMLTPPADESQLPLVNRVIELLPFGAILRGGDLASEESHPHAKKVAAQVGSTLTPEGGVNVDTVFTRASTSYDPNERSFQIEADQDLVDALRAFAHHWDLDHPEAGRLNVTEVDGDVHQFYMRMWHVAPEADDIELDTDDDPDGPPLGDTGVVPLFHAPGRPGDYWIAALRSETPQTVVPFDLRSPGGVAPHGPRHFVAPVFYLTGDEDVVDTADDLRPRMRRTTDDTCITFTVGDGVHTIGDFRSIQKAIEALPSEGGRIVVRPGFYPELVRIVNRRNVILEGCGESSVIETPLANQGARLIEVVNAEGVSISGFRLQSYGQSALFAANVVDLNLANLTAVMGSPVNGVFTRGALFPGTFLIDLSEVAAVTGRSLVLDAFQGAGLRVIGCELVTLNDISGFGSEEQGPEPTAPLIDITSSALVKLRDSTLECFGQVGVAVRGAFGQDVELSNLVISAKAHKSAAGFHEARSGVDIEAGEQIVLEKSRITLEASASNHAGVVVRGSVVTIRGNQIEALEGTTGSPLAWGGIHVRGGAERVEVRNNRITGGVGHGITLGSVLWRTGGSPVGGGRREAVGRAQLSQDAAGLTVLDRNLGTGFSDANGIDLFPEDEGPVRDLVIADNRIERMATNGISAITVLGLRGLSNELIEVQRARIEGNTISNNLRRLDPNLPFAEALPFPAAAFGAGIDVSVLPFGGIVLGTASDGIDIRNNTIVENGNTPAEPEQSPVSPVSPVQPTVQPNDERIPINGIFILNGEGISITGNRILNNGLRVTGRALFRGVRAGIAVLLAGTDTASNLNTVSSLLFNSLPLDSRGSSLRVAGNTVLQREGRALLAIGTGPISITGNHFGSLGFHGADTPIDAHAVGDAVFVQNMGAPWESHDISSVPLETATPAGIPRGFVHEFDAYFTPAKTKVYLKNEDPANFHAFAGIGGGISFLNNQIVFDWRVERRPLAGVPLGYSPVALLANDHVAVSGNQFGMRLDETKDPPPAVTTFGTEPLWTLALIIGATLDVSRNRWSSGFRNSTVSLVTFAELMSSVTFNQMTHDFIHFIRSEIGEHDDQTPDTDPNFVFNENLVQFGNQAMASRSRELDSRNPPLIDPTQSSPALTTRLTRTLINNLFVRLLRLRPSDVSSPITGPI